MKKLITFILIAFAGLGASAQNRYFGYLGEMPLTALVNHSSEQGHDRLDSLYFIKTKTYIQPFFSKEEKDAVKNLIDNIVGAYNHAVSSCDGGFCSSSSLNTDITPTGKEVSLYYAENHDPFIVGGEGRNYAILRTRDPHNLHYRWIDGVEWWKEPDNRNVSFRFIELYGPISEELYRRSLVDDDASLPDYTQKNALGISGKNLLCQQIKKLAGMYKNQDDSMDIAIVEAINERISTYINSVTVDEMLSLCQVLKNVPGYWAQINGSQTGSFEWLSMQYSSLKVLRISHSVRGEPFCVNNPKAKNFLLEITAE